MAAKAISKGSSLDEVDPSEQEFRPRQDSSFISSNLPNRPRGPLDNPHYDIRPMQNDESMLDFLRYLEQVSDKEFKSKAVMKMVQNVPIESVLKSQLMDWSSTAIPDEHLWAITDSGSDMCHLAETFECQDQKIAHQKRPRVKCTGCGIVVHPGCVYSLEKNLIGCKVTFRDAGKKVRELSKQCHHWNKVRKCNSDCKRCNRGFRGMSYFQKDFAGMHCSWCHDAYHLNCFDDDAKKSHCTYGILHQSIVPPPWIVKLPPAVDHQKDGSFSRRRRATVRRSGRKKCYDDKASPYFKVKASGYGRENKTPLLVFINPRSGGNQGVRLLSTFQSLLNPRQIFDLSQGGPEFGLRMFSHLNNLRILVCGGDGTVGWVLSKLDDMREELDLTDNPPMAILPLGTGNDLARTLGWGGGYSDEPIEKIIRHVSSGAVITLDRWLLGIKKNNEIPSYQHLNSAGCADAPLHVVNSYFSIGMDAGIALEFHESREANPSKFNRRYKNKFFYANQSGKELILRKYQDLCANLRLVVDGVDWTDRIRTEGFEAILFLNINKYGSGCTPWGVPSHRDFKPQSCSDGYIEIVGLWSRTLPKLLLGGHGERLVQGTEIKLTTAKSLPIQIDGEACLLKPSVITFSLKNQVPMIQKTQQLSSGRRKGTTLHSPFASNTEVIKLCVETISVEDYKKYKEDLYGANKNAKHIGLINTKASDTLKKLRENLLERYGKEEKLPKFWCFVDVAHQNRRQVLYQLEEDQETDMTVADMSCDGILLLELLYDSSDEDFCTLVRCQSTPTGQLIQMRKDEKGRRLSAPAEEPETEFSSNGDLSNGKLQHLKEVLRNKPVPSRDSLIATEIHEEDENQDDSELPIMSDSSSGDLYFPSDEESPSPPPQLQDVNIKLIEAAKRGNLEEVVKCCVEKSCNLGYTDIEGFTALHHAARHGKKEIVRHLVQKLSKEQLNYQEKIRQQTALHKAAWYGYRTICVLLIEAGASLVVQDYQGFTPLQRARQSDDNDLERYLEEKEKMEQLRSQGSSTQC